MSVERHPDQFLTFTMPERIEPYKNKRPFPFFKGLITEGWLLEIASKNTDNGEKNHTLDMFQMLGYRDLLDLRYDRIKQGN